jgi:excisionase family DNA binding protein
MSDDELTLQEAADTLGVHYMTAYRYVRLGLLQASKSGGTWRVRTVDLDAFRAGTSPSPEAGKRRAPWAERLQARLIAGDARGAWGVIEAAMSAGAEMDEIYLDVLGPAMTAIGAEWESGAIDVAVEHRATGIAMRIVGRLGPRFARRGRTRGAVIIGAPAGERHSLPVAMLADLVRGGGWDVSDLGADVPHQSFVVAASSTPDLAALGISVTTPNNAASAAEAVAAVRAEFPHLLIVVGGAGIEGAAHAATLGDARYAPNGRVFLELLDRQRAEEPSAHVAV